MPWIPHLMVLDDDPRVLDSLVPGFAHDLARGLGRSPAVAEALRRGESAGAARGAPIHLKVTQAARIPTTNTTVSWRPSARRSRRWSSESPSPFAGPWASSRAWGCWC